MPNRAPCRCCDAAFVGDRLDVAICDACQALHDQVRGLDAEIAALDQRRGEAVGAHADLHDRVSVGTSLVLDIPVPSTLEELLAEIKAARYEPTPPERELARRHPSIAWLLDLSPDDREFYLDVRRLRLLMAENPTVPKETWISIFTQGVAA